MNTKIEKEIENLLITAVRTKLELYVPETIYMPFHHLLLGKDRYAMFSFIHSINTTFGMSIWEQVAVVLSRNAGTSAKRQYKLLGLIDRETEELIRKIHHNLRKGEGKPNQKDETEQIRRSIKPGNLEKDPDSQVDLFIKDKSKEFYFDVISAKPNIKEFGALHLKLLRWKALRLSQDKNTKVYTKLAIPYNPYHPGSYERWTLRGLYDMDNGEILVGEEFWNFVAGENVYDDLLKIFKNAGDILRPEIDKKFKSFKNK